MCSWGHDVTGLWVNLWACSGPSGIWDSTSKGCANKVEVSTDFSWGSQFSKSRLKSLNVDTGLWVESTVGFKKLFYFYFMIMVEICITYQYNNNDDTTKKTDFQW